MKHLILSILASLSLFLHAKDFTLNTDNLTFTQDGFGNVPLTSFQNGVTLTTSYDVASGFAVFSWDGDLNIGYDNTYKVEGSRPIRMVVNGNLWLPSTGAITASAVNHIGHAGGGNGGGEISGGLGGDGGDGTTVAGGAGGRGGKTTTNPNGANGSQGGAGNQGRNGGISKVNHGEDGFGASGSLGKGGVQSDIKSGGTGAPPVAKAAVGAGGTGDDGTDGGAGFPGNLGNTGAPGTNGPNGIGGANGNSTSAFAFIAGGGGSSGVSGSGGGGGSSGSAGAGGGGGSLDNGLFTEAAGGDGGTGGRPGSGGKGDKGGNGGAGGGGGGIIDLQVTKQFVWDGVIRANGGNGSPGSAAILTAFRDGVDGSNGSSGSSGDSVGSLSGGNGGNGGKGGKGGNGGEAGKGGHGAGGAGGSIKVQADHIWGRRFLYTIGGSGVNGSPSGANGANRIDIGEEKVEINCSSFNRVSDSDAITDISYNTNPGMRLSISDPLSNNPDSKILEPAFQAFEYVTRLRIDQRNEDGSAAAEKSFFQARVLSRAETFNASLPPYVFSEDFETDSGWTISTPSVAHSFNIGDPTFARDNQNNLIGPGAPPSGTNCLATSIAGNYADNLNTSATSPTITLPASDRFIISYWEWFDIEDNWDKAKVDLILQGGININLQEEFPVGAPEIEGKWVRRIYSAEGSPVDVDLNIIFNFTSDSSINRPGWYIDDIKVYVEND